MAAAVRALSPVIMATSMPRRRSSSTTASGLRAHGVGDGEDAASGAVPSGEHGGASLRFEVVEGAGELVADREAGVGEEPAAADVDRGPVDDGDDAPSGRAAEPVRPNWRQ